MPEFLVYVPSQQSFATFYMSNKTSRRVASDLLTLLGKAATLKIQLIKNKSHSWHGPVITPCSAPLDVPEDYEEIVNTFNNPKETEVEAAPRGDERPR